MENIPQDTNAQTKTYNIKDCKKPHASHAAGSGIYGLAFVGAAVYFLQHSVTFWAGVVGILKALVWPALLVYKLLEFLKM